VTHVIMNGQTLTASAEADLERRLRALPPPPGPDARFRAELRTQLIAAVERGPATDRFSPDRARPSTRRRAVSPRSAPAPRRGPGELLGAFLHPGRRALAVLSAALAVVLVITGTTYWLAQRALPGDALYGLKRAGESVDLSTKGGDTSRGSAYLSISSTRIDEAFELVKRETSAAVPGTGRHGSGISAAPPLNAHVDELVHGVLTDGDTAAVTATRLLTTASVSNRAMKPAVTVSTWLHGQNGKVRDLVERLPETAPSTAGGAARLLQRDLNQIQTRVKAIAVSVKCTTCGFTKSDRLGPLPCPLCSAPAPTTTTTTTTPPTTVASRPLSATTTPGQPSSTVGVRTTVASPTVVPTQPGTVPAPGPGTTGSTTTAPVPLPPPTTTTTPAPTTQPAPPPPPTTTTPSDTGTPAPPTTAPEPTTDPATTDPTLPSLPTCLPVICTDASATANLIPAATDDPAAGPTS
jgi:Domain of unknown function (DUF5667)